MSEAKVAKIKSTRPKWLDVDGSEYQSVDSDDVMGLARMLIVALVVVLSLVVGGSLVVGFAVERFSGIIWSFLQGVS